MDGMIHSDGGKVIKTKADSEKAARKYDVYLHKTTDITLFK